MPEHDPIRFATDLGAKLAARSRHVCAFLGAGVGCTCGLPDVAKLQAIVLAALVADDAKAFKKQLDKGNLATALERRRVPYFDGFVGTLRAGFNTGLVEGSVGRDDEC